MDGFVPGLENEKGTSKNGRMVESARIIHGPQVNDRSPWDTERKDKLFEALFHAAAHYGSETTFAALAASVGDSADNIIKKVAKNNNEKGGPFPYTPENRTDRTGMPWTKIDRHVISLATAPQGRIYGGHTPAHIGKVLGRSEASVRAWMLAQVVGLYKEELTDLELAERIHHKLTNGTGRFTG